MSFDPVALVKIILIDIVLSGDNAVVIALACRNLTEKHRRIALFWGVLGAITLRITLTFFATQIFSLPYLKLLGCFLLLWIGIKLVLPEKNTTEVKENEHLGMAIKTIVLADLVMSLDNVVAVAAAAQGSFALLIFGLLLSVPLIVFSSQLLLKLMETQAWIVWAGAALLGFVAGELGASDPIVSGRLFWPYAAQMVGVLGATVVLLVANRVLQKQSKETKAQGAE